MASLDERSREQRLLPLQLAIAPSERDRERRDPPTSVRSRARCVLAIEHRPHLQDRESAGSMKVVTCAVFALLRRSNFPPQRRQRNSEGVAVLSPLPCF